MSGLVDLVFAVLQVDELALTVPPVELAKGGNLVNNQV